MKFRIIGCKGNSVRVVTGIITFDVQVIDDGKLKIMIPPNMFIAHSRDFDNLAGAVLGHYNNTIGEINNNEQSNNSR